MSEAKVPSFMTRLADLRLQLQQDPGQSARVLRELVASLKSEHVLPAAEVAKRLVGQKHDMAASRIYVLGEPTTNAIAAAVSVAALRNGVIAEVRSGAYGALSQEILDPNSDLYRYRPQILVLVPNPVLRLEVSDAQAADVFVRDQLASYAQIWSSIAERLPGCRVIQHLYELPDLMPVGIAERRLPWSTSSLTAAVNAGLLERAPPFVHLVDMDGLCAQVGRAHWRDQRLWFHGKLPFAPRHLAEYTVVFGAAMRRAMGQSKKALILDLDNTLWGGVVGDDGLDGIKLGPGDAEGEAYVEFCHYVQQLGRRGVILGVCSKNNRDVAARVFMEHPHMPLKLDDFSVFTCNWDDKASNLRQMIAELNIDPSAVVFADDNLFECGLIKQELPTVEVIELTGDPAGFAGRVARLRLFDSDGLSAEDLGRTASYKARSKAEGLRTSAASLEEYLRSLKMRAEMWRAEPRDVARLVQMEGKTNQFNLTTRRFSSEQLTRFLEDRNFDLYCFKLMDRFADHGLVGSMLIEYRGSEIHILSWLLSCRVFSRGCEEFMLGFQMREARKKGARSLVGHFVPTERNKVVANLYSRLGFNAVEGEGLFVLNVQAADVPTSFILEV